jgi:hypothetical protein
MKKLTLTFLTLFSLNSHAITWKVFGPCDSINPVVQGEAIADLTQSVGANSVMIFDQHKVPYVGVAEGFNSIINTPIGLDSIEVVSDNELRAYGWCFLVNGRMPEAMPSQVHFKSQADVLIWFYAYSTNKNNEWMDDYCSPAYWIKAKQFCETPK